MSNVTATILTNATAAVVPLTPGRPEEETDLEFFSDILFGIAFLTVAITAAERMSKSRQSGGVETNVVTAFYSLILLTSLLRAIWFLIPDTVFDESYVPHAVKAFHTGGWLGGFISELLVSSGSLCLFSIFILILVYWADILKKYFQPGVHRSRPMSIFLNIVSVLTLIEVANAMGFLLGFYSSEGMILVNAILLSIVSIVCVVEITIFSHKFRTVLQTLGAINQVSTESQVKRIVWITVTGNLFFFTRAFIETIFAVMLICYWSKHGNVGMTLSHGLWDTYMSIKHWSEVIILGLMLYILQSRFTNNTLPSSREGYQQVPAAEQDGAEGQGKEVTV